MDNGKWVLSIRTSLPGKRVLPDDVKTSFFVFDRFEDARAAMREKLRGFAYGESNAIFDGEGHIRALRGYTEIARRFESIGTDRELTCAISMAQDALAAALAGENAALPFEDYFGNDGAVGIEVCGGKLAAFWGCDVRLCAVDPYLKTDIFDMTEERDYYLHALVDYMVEDCAAELYVDLKRAEN